MNRRGEGVKFSQSVDSESSSLNQRVGGGGYGALGSVLEVLFGLFCSRK